MLLVLVLAFVSGVLLTLICFYYLDNRDRNSTWLVYQKHEIDDILQRSERDLKDASALYLLLVSDYMKETGWK